MMTQPGVGVAVFLFNEREEIVLGERIGSHGAGTWSIPGGRLELAEPAAFRASTEVEEETGIVIPPSDLIQRGWVDAIWVDPDKGPQHWVTLFFMARISNNRQPEVREPNKCKQWIQVRVPVLYRVHTHPLFPPLRAAIQRHGLPTSHGMANW